MQRIFNVAGEELIIWTAVLAALVAVAIYVIGKLRNAPAQREPVADELLAKCRESHSRGELSNEEFRTIRTTLEERLREELRDDGQRG
jgi:uncharacterized membrane protein